MTYDDESPTGILSSLIQIPSVNPMGGPVDEDICFEGRMTDWLENFFRRLSVPYERMVVQPGRDNIVAKYESPGQPSTVLLDAHQDTVPVDGMTVAPFTPTIRDNRIYGRGSCDVKGGMAAMLSAFRRLVVERPAGAASVVMSCTCDEEATTTGINDLITTWTTAKGRSRLLQNAPDAAIIAEPTSLDVVVAHKGVTRFKITTNGRACHSSDPSQGVNAIYRMAKLTQALEDYADQLTTRPSHPLCGGPTLSVGRIMGGTSVNIVPDSCVVEIDRRVAPGEDRSNIIEDIRKHLSQRLDFQFDFAPPWVESPALSDRDNGALAAAVLNQVNAGGTAQRSIGVPFGTHASRTCAVGVPSVVFGPGSIDQAHTRDEFVPIDELERAADVYFEVCRRSPELW